MDNAYFGRVAVQRLTFIWTGGCWSWKSVVVIDSATVDGMKR